MIHNTANFRSTKKRMMMSARGAAIKNGGASPIGGRGYFLQQPILAIRPGRFHAGSPGEPKIIPPGLNVAGPDVLVGAHVNSTGFALMAKSETFVHVQIYRPPHETNSPGSFQS
jgi:hypothetical protein